jgi:hypothetical protein
VQSNEGVIKSTPAVATVRRRTASRLLVAVALQIGTTLPGLLRARVRSRLRVRRTRRLRRFSLGQLKPQFDNVESREDNTTLLMGCWPHFRGRHIHPSGSQEQQAESLEIQRHLGKRIVAGRSFYRPDKTTRRGGVRFGTIALCVLNGCRLTADKDGGAQVPWSGIMLMTVKDQSDTISFAETDFQDAAGVHSAGGGRRRAPEQSRLLLSTAAQRQGGVIKGELR